MIRQIHIFGVRCAGVPDARIYELHERRNIDRHAFDDLGLSIRFHRKFYRILHQYQVILQAVCLIRPDIAADLIIPADRILGTGRVGLLIDRIPRRAHDPSATDFDLAVVGISILRWFFVFRIIHTVMKSQKRVIIDLIRYICRNILTDRNRNSRSL